MGSSDIHIEPLTHIIRIRYRVDGQLREILEYQPFLHQQIVARFKIMSNLKIDESRIPQDGRLSTTIGTKSLDLRVSTLPTVHGEKIVMRIVDKSKSIPDLNDLGIEGKNRTLLEKAISLPNGIILTSGPTGSGKSTTLYSCLSRLNKPDVNIMTLEDPVILDTRLRVGFVLPFVRTLILLWWVKFVITTLSTLRLKRHSRGIS